MSAEATLEAVALEPFTNGNLPSLNEADERLVDLAAQGDVAGLREIGDQAAAYQEYEQRQGFKRRADYYGSLKVLAEAQLGGLPNLGIPGLSPRLLDTWQLLATGRDRGVLASTMKEIAEGQDITTSAVANELQRRGVRYVPNKPLRKAFDLAHKRDGLTLDELGSRTGRSGQQVSQQLGRCNSSAGHRRTVIGYRNALPLARELGVELSELPLAPLKKRRRRRRRRLPLRRLTGGRWDETYSRLRKTLDEFGAVAGEGEEWDEAYAHFYALEEIVGKAMKGER